MSDLQVCMLTPAGRGAIATIAIRGPRAVDAVANHFQTIQGDFRGAINRIRFGRWKSETHDSAGETVVVCAVDEEIVEIHSHGGRAVVQMIMDDLCNDGAQAVDPAVWLASRRDPLAAECELVLTRAATKRTAAIAMDQVNGSLRRDIISLIADLGSGKVDVSRARIQTLLSRYAIGKAITVPFNVVIAGPPNVGKSTLINAILGYQRAITMDQPGTTRDALTATTNIDGWTINLVDTAGIRDGGGAIEREGIRRAQRWTEAADLIVLLIDATLGIQSEHQQIAASAKDLMKVWNKVDVVSDPIGIGAGDLQISAASGWGIDELIGNVARRLVSDPPERGEAVPITERQAYWLRQAMVQESAAKMVEDLTRLTDGTLAPSVL